MKKCLPNFYLPSVTLVLFSRPYPYQHAIFTIEQTIRYEYQNLPSASPELLINKPRGSLSHCSIMAAWAPAQHLEMTGVLGLLSWRHHLTPQQVPCGSSETFPKDTSWTLLWLSPQWPSWAVYLKRLCHVSTEPQRGFNVLISEGRGLAQS